GLLPGRARTRLRRRHRAACRRPARRDAWLRGRTHAVGGVSESTQPVARGAAARRVARAARLRSGVCRDGGLQRRALRAARPRGRPRRPRPGRAPPATARPRPAPRTGAGAGRGGQGMRIGMGALVGTRGGPATYARELVAARARLGGHRYVVFTDRPDDFAALDVERVHVPLPTTYHQ